MKFNLKLIAILILPTLVQCAQTNINIKKINVDNFKKWQIKRFFKAIKQNNEKEVEQMLLQNNNLISELNKNERTALHLTAAYGFFNITKLLIDTGANINAKDKNNATPLHMAALKGHDDSVRFLLIKKADIDSKDRFKQTPSDLAKRFNNEKALAMLINMKSYLQRQKDFLLASQ